MFKQLDMLYSFVQHELDDLIRNSISSVDMEELASILQKANGDSDIGRPLVETIYKLLVVADYIETQTDLESVLMDDTYDMIHEKYIDLTGHAITGTNGTSGSNRPTGQHKYPDLRGSIDKTHFIYDKDIPKNDSRKSLESWLRTAFKKCEAAGLFKNGIVEFYNNLLVGAWFKYDGASAVFEIENNQIARVLTRKDTDTNTGTDISHIFKNLSMRDIFGNTLSEDVYNADEIGIQTEVLMHYSNVEKFGKTVPKAPKNHRSAVTMVMTTMDYFNEDWVQYITVEPIHIISKKPLNMAGPPYGEWMCIIIDDVYHYYRTTDMLYGDDEWCTDNDKVPYDIDTLVDRVLKNMDNQISTIIDVSKGDIPMDGIVFTLVSDDVARVLGRSDNKNKYQVAFKFIAGEAKTKVKNVTFPVGPVTGLVTPLVEFEPVKIMGNTITNATLSNIDKFERMNLHIDDEIIVKYNIVPAIYKTDECKESNNPLIEFPKVCPVCGEELNIKVNEDSGNRTVRCINYDCPSRIAGKIFNYINKLNIMGIGESIIENLIENGLLNTIGDLYRLQVSDMERLPGYGHVKATNIVNAIHSRLTMYPHDLLGSIGIPDVGRRVMKKVCTEIPFEDIINMEEDVISRMSNIKGIGDKLVLKICEGVLHNKDLIDDVLHYVTIKQYEDEETSMKVLFTTVRDKEFAQYLVDKYGAEIKDNYTKDTTLVIVKDENSSSTKITQARQDGKEVITLKEAKERFK